MVKNKLSQLLFMLMLVIIPVFFSASNVAASDVVSEHESDMKIMRGFADQQAEEGEAVKISDKEKHRWLFFMGASLLLLILSTASFGIATGVFGKNYFVAHMVTAGLTVTLALAHAVAATVWFYPF